MASIHDSLLVGYTVNGDEQTIILHTRPHQGGGTVRIDIIFRGVAAYDFEGDCLGNIVFAVREVTARSIIGDGAKFTELFRQYGWPGGWNTGQESLEDFFARKNCRLFELTCSYGMYGWIAAVEMELKVLE